MPIKAFVFAMNTVEESKMSVSSTLSSQSKGDLVYISDASDQQWSPHTSTENHRPNPVLQWQDVHYDNNNIISHDPGQIYAVQRTNQGDNLNYSQHYNANQPSKEYVDLTYQKRDNFNGNGHYTQNGNVPNVIFHAINGMNVRSDPVHINAQYIPRTEAPNLNNVWNGSTNRNHIPRTNWNANQKPTNGVKKAKRIRTAFTTQQMMELELEYARTRYLDRNRRIELSETLHLTEKTIKVWFQNRRMKDKKDRSECMEDLEATSTTESSPEGSLPPPPPYNNIHQSLPYNGMGYQVNRPVERYQVPLPVLDTNAIPVPVQNAVVNAYPNFFIQPHHGVPLDVTHNINQPNQLEPVHYDRVVLDEEIVNVSPEANEVEEKSNTEEVVSNSTKDEEHSPEQYINERKENWELSWVRIMDMNDQI